MSESNTPEEDDDPLNIAPLIDGFYELMYDRNPEFEVDSPTDPIQNMMNNLADVASNALKHYLRLAIYQRDINNALDLFDGGNKEKFTNVMPTVKE